MGDLIKNDQRREEDTGEKLPTYWEPEGIARFALWGADIVQSVSVTIVPAFAYIIALAGHVEDVSTYPYLWAMIGGALLFAAVAFVPANPSRYSSKGVSYITPVSLAGFLFNVSFLIIVLCVA
ncbi:hypothetical protein [Streptomyces sp. NPDC021096]|uniref:hypothetical protein n=1 Tax=Streptomyces sp. NPDC021096 TaxID=3154792 RepID=UPI0033C92696